MWRISDGSADPGKCFLSSDRVIGKGQIQFDEQPGHVAQKQIDRSTALEPELIINEHHLRNRPHSMTGGSSITH